MNAQIYKYDVAFSFLAQDELLATQLNDLLQDRVRTFLYLKKQKEIAGTDGEKTFNLVFGEQARFVVVLFRENWGQTAWTRIEETAIRNRAHVDGYDFVKFIPLDDKPTVPKWLPRTQLWMGFKRWGIETIAGMIEARIEELGGQPHEETVGERAARLARAMVFRESRKQFLQSGKGVDAANKEYDALHDELKRLIETVNCAASSISLKLKAAPQQMVILGLEQGLSIDWVCHYRFSLDDSELVVVLWDAPHPPFPDVIHPFEKPAILQNIRFKFDLLPTDQVMWVSSDSRRHSYSTCDLASFILKYHMNAAGEKTSDIYHKEITIV